MPRKKKEQKPTEFSSQKKTLSELLDELEEYRDKYGKCFVASIGNTSGEYKGMMNPYVMHLRINANESKAIYFSSTHDKIRKAVG